MPERPREPAVARAAQVTDVLAAVEAGDPASARLALHPYLHFTDPFGRTVRGRVEVLDLLARYDRLEPPAAVEMRDGQVQR